MLSCDTGCEKLSGLASLLCLNAERCPSEGLCSAMTLVLAKAMGTAPRQGQAQRMGGRAKSIKIIYHHRGICLLH